MPHKLLFCLVGIILLTGSVSNVQGYEIDAEFTLDTSETVSFDSYEGKYILIDSMATWCGPCRIEMLDLKEVYDATHDQDEFEMLTISMDPESDSLQDVERFMKDFDAKWSYGLDHNRDLFDHFGVKGYPTTLFLDKDGTLIKRWEGLTEANDILRVMDDYMDIPGELARDLKLDQLLENLLNNKFFFFFLIFIWMFIIYSVYNFIGKIKGNTTEIEPEDEELFPDLETETGN